MLVLMIDGDEHDAARLCELVQRAGFGVDVRRIDSSELGARGGAAPRPDTEAHGEPALAAAARRAPGPTALVFEARDRPEFGAAALTVVRAGKAFDGIPAIVALTLDRADWFAGARGFDDFVLHPWSPGELLGRIRAAEIRREGVEASALVEINGVRMDPAAREASIGGESVHLTARELALLTYLSVRRGRVLSRNHLLEHVWGDTYRGGPRTVDVHIRRLRSKLGRALQIDTVRSGGYRLRAAGAGAGREAARPS